MRLVSDLNKKLNNCRSSLIQWSRQEFKDNIMQINRVKKQLRSMPLSNDSDAVLDEERALKSKLHALWKREEIYWKQRSKIRWLAHGDRNTKFFHKTTLSRRRRNKIIQLRRDNGDWVEGDRAIKTELHSFYSNLFSSDRQQGGSNQLFANSLASVPNQVSTDMKNLLTRMATGDEVRKACFQMGGSRAPGPDGFSCIFFQKSWNTAGPDMITSVNAFLSTGIMPSFIN